MTAIHKLNAGRDGATIVACMLLATVGFSCTQVSPPTNDNDNTPANTNDNTPANTNDNTPANTNDNEPPAEKTAHAVIFDDVLGRNYEGPSDCLICHSDVGDEMLASGHWNWQGTSTGIIGREEEIHGKRDLINNFCIAVPSNEGRCTQCHPSYGWSNNSFDFEDPANIDCLICHDTTGTYSKAKATAGLPEEGVDLQVVARAVGEPSRENCGKCHYFAGGGDNVKHGDLAAVLNNTSREADVHMGVDGLNYSCQQCHITKDHGIAGMPLHSRDEAGVDVACTNCHIESNLHQELDVINIHLDSVACQACHIPAIARQTPTKTYWDWSEAGQDIDPIPTDQFGKPTYDKKKGSFVWDMNVKPELKWFNGQWRRVVISDERHYETLPAILAEPVGSFEDAGSKLYPFKKMEGKTPADPVNQIMVVPHLFGTAGGENPYWGKFDWKLALEEGAAYAGQDYSGEYEFVETVMYMSVNHEIAPKEQALGCTDCHAGGIDWVELGFDDDPWEGTGRP